jgi:hypothetical protein
MSTSAHMCCQNTAIACFVATCLLCGRVQVLLVCLLPGLLQQMLTSLAASFCSKSVRFLVKMLAFISRAAAQHSQTQQYN